MKEGLVGLSSLQVASIRIISSGLVLLPLAIRHIRKYSARQIGLMFISGLLGSVIPAILFCEAETGLDSSTAGVLNSLTPIFVIIVGALFFQARVAVIKILGMLLAFGGSVLLYYSHANISAGNNVFNMFLIVIATVCYGFNVNLVQRYMLGIPSLHIAAIALVTCSLPSTIVLLSTDFASLPLDSAPILWSIFYTSILGVVGTALASILFYVLIKRAGMVFASMVTYGIPIIAFGWGILYGEEVGWKEAGCMLIILAGVYICNAKNTKKTIPSKI